MITILTAAIEYLLADHRSITIRIRAICMLMRLCEFDQCDFNAIIRDVCATTTWASFESIIQTTIEIIDDWSEYCYYQQVFTDPEPTELAKLREWAGTLI